MSTFRLPEFDAYSSVQEFLTFSAFEALPSVSVGRIATPVFDETVFEPIILQALADAQNIDRTPIPEAPGGNDDPRYQDTAVTSNSVTGEAEYISIINNGPSENRINVWYVGDGYTADQREQFIADVQEQFNILTTGELNQPFEAYSQYFNVHAVFKASAEEGADRPDDNVFVDTAFNASYSWGGSVERCLYFSTSLANTAINEVAPEGTSADVRFGLINDSKYGGCGGSYGVFAAQNAAAAEIASHEVGHSYADLADEYWTNGDTYTGGEPGDANVTTDPTGAKWSHWLGFEQDGLSTVGAYEGGFYNEFGVYRPTEDSKMRSLNNPFDAIAREEFVIKFYSDVDAIESASFESIDGVLVNPTLEVDVIDTSVVSFEWFVGGVLMQDETSSILDLSALELAAGDYNVTLRVADSSGYVRRDLDLVTELYDWDISISDGGGQGTEFSDAIFGVSDDETIDGLGGDDELYGKAGNDTLFGGAGSDYIDGGDGNDLLIADDFEGDVTDLLSSLGLA